MEHGATLPDVARPFPSEGTGEGVDKDFEHHLTISRGVTSDRDYLAAPVIMRHLARVQVVDTSHLAFLGRWLMVDGLHRTATANEGGTVGWFIAAHLWSYPKDPKLSSNCAARGGIPHVASTQSYARCQSRSARASAAEAAVATT